jgi:hypothetical protein
LVESFGRIFKVDNVEILPESAKRERSGAPDAPVGQKSKTKFVVADKLLKVLARKPY